MVRADLVTGLVLVALGGAVVVESLRMPRFEHLNINPYTVPGLVPGALGAVILVLGAALFVRAARAGGGRAGGRAGPAAWLTDPGVRRLLLAVGLCVGYAAGLVGRLPFWLATFLFVTGFVALFEWPLATTRSERARRIAFALVFGALISAVVTLVFQKIFLVRLP
jgi:Tripartite tricarboxylate transporter TctB family